MAIGVSRVGETRETAESDSPFVSAADFFSLLSLTLIYVVIVVAGPAQPGTNSVTWVNTAQHIISGGTGENLTFVVLSPASDGVKIRMYREKTKLDVERLVRFVPAEQAQAKGWLATVLQNDPPQERVVFNLGPVEQRPEAHKLFYELLDATQQKYPTTQAFKKSADESNNQH